MLFGLAVAAATAFLMGGGYGQLRSLLAQRPDTIVRVAGPPRFAGVATLVEELNIGMLNGPEEYTFGQIHDVTADKDGSIYVYDRSARIIRRFDSTGKHVSAFGRFGEGPGEVTSAAGMRVLTNGQLALYDSRLARINIYSATGDNVRQIRVPAGGATIGHRHGFAADAAGFVYVHQTIIRRIPAAADARASVETDRMWLRIRLSDGSVVDTLPEPRWESPPPEPFRATSSNGWRQMAMPFLARQIMTISPQGYAVTGNAERYSFELLVSPRRVISVRRNVPATEVSRVEYAAARSRIENGMREVDPGWTWNGRDIPGTKPFYDAIDVGLDGRIWVTRDVTPLPQARPPATGRAGGAASIGPSGDEVFVARPTLYDVFEPDGTFIGAVQAPPMATLMAMRGDHAWGTFRGADDVEFVRRFRIIWGKPLK
jgi:hypothetical protein